MPQPPFGLDPHAAIRDPEALPVLLRRGMYDVIRRRTRGVPTYDDFVEAFNIIAWSLKTAGNRPGARESIPRLARITVEGPPGQRRIELTRIGRLVERERKKLRDTDMKLRWISRWAEMLREADPRRASLSYEEYRRGRRP